MQRIRNHLPMDVRDLMDKAAERNVMQQESRRAMTAAAEISVLKGVVALESSNAARLWDEGGDMTLRTNERRIE
jgi:hypothetical protein